MLPVHVRLAELYHLHKTGKLTDTDGPERIGALVDIGEPLLIIVEPEALEEEPDDPLPPGWEESEV